MTVAGNEGRVVGARPRGGKALVNDRRLKIILLAVGAMLGVLLIIIGSIGGSSGTERAGGDDGDEETRRMREYREETEARVRALCEAVCGVGDGSVTVTVTLGGGYENVYATSGERRQSQSGDSTKTEYLTVGNGSSESAIRLTVRPPAITGIGVVCRGGGDPEVRAELTYLLCAAFGIGAARVYICELG